MSASPYTCTATHRPRTGSTRSGGGEVTHPELDTLTPFCCRVPLAELVCDRSRSARAVRGGRDGSDDSEDSLDAFVDGFDEQASDVSEPAEDGECQDEPDPRFPFLCTRVFGHHWARESREVPETKRCLSPSPARQQSTVARFQHMHETNSRAQKVLCTTMSSYAVERAPVARPPAAMTEAEAPRRRQRGT